MSQANLAKIAFSLAAGEGQEYAVGADFIRLDVFPLGLLLGVNSGNPKTYIEGLLYKTSPGESHIRLLRIVNQTTGTLTGEFTHGTGDVDFPGVAALIGSVPLPSGASTAALQTTGNTSAATVAAQTTALAASTVEVPELIVMGASTSTVFAGCRSISILNTNTAAVNVTVTTPGGARTLAPGQSVSWSVTKPLATLSNITVATAASGSANVAYTT